MRELFEGVRQLLREGKGAVLATIISDSGSTPRGAGSHMLVRPDGTTAGTVGGGAVEYRSTLAAGEALASGRSFTRSFCLTRGGTEDIGMVCGGDVEVYFQYFDPENPQALAGCEAVLKALAGDGDSWLVLDLTCEERWQLRVAGGPKQKGCPSGDGESDAGTGMTEREPYADLLGPAAGLREADGRRLYIEPLTRAGKVYVFGGGHVARELVPLLAHVGFRCTVMDDRPEFANREVFPDAERTVAGDMARIGDYFTITSHDFVCVMTRGHQYDYYVQRQALAAGPLYLGVMGSRSKIRVVTEKLLADGFSLEQIEACHMPIGTDIGAETPQEIAVSVAGELIAVRAAARRQAVG